MKIASHRISRIKCTLPFFLFILLISCHAPKPDIILDRTDPYAEINKPIVTFYKNVPTEILDRLIESESSWIVNAKSNKPGENSIGLAQVNMKWLAYFKEKYGLKDPMKPSEALDFAADYLHDLYLATGSWYEAVLAYKCGLNGRHNAPGNIRKIAYWVVNGRNK